MQLERVADIEPVRRPTARGFPDLTPGMLRAHLAELGPRFVDPATLELLIERYADTRSRILSAYFPAPSAGFIERDGKRFRFRFDPAIMSAFWIAQPGPCGNMAASIPLQKQRYPRPRTKDTPRP